MILDERFLFFLEEQLYLYILKDYKKKFITNYFKMDDFYVYLPSNVKSIFFENTSANFKTKLSQILHLKNDYEVGLAEITYTFAILNVFDDEIINIVYLNNAGEIDKTSVTLKKGFYTIEELIKSINNIIQLNISYITLPKFELNNENVNRKVKIINGRQM